MEDGLTGGRFHGGHVGDGFCGEGDELEVGASWTRPALKRNRKREATRTKSSHTPHLPTHLAWPRGVLIMVSPFCLHIRRGRRLKRKTLCHGLLPYNHDGTVAAGRAPRFVHAFHQPVSLKCPASVIHSRPSLVGRDEARVSQSDVAGMAGWMRGVDGKDGVVKDARWGLTSRVRQLPSEVIVIRAIVPCRTLSGP